MTKQEQFLWAIQTLMLLRANHRGREPGISDAEISAGGHMAIIDNALRVSTRIPESLNAADAATGFYSVYFTKDAAVPSWMAG